MAVPKLDLAAPLANAQALTEGWSYRVAPEDERFVADASAGFDSSLWQPAIVPMLYQGALDRSTVWYRRSFDQPCFEDANARALLRFGGALLETTVWLDGEELGQHEEGFTPFGFDITDALRSRPRHVLVVRCRFPEERPEDHAAVAGAGIYAAGTNRPYPVECRGQLPHELEWPLPVGCWAPVELVPAGPLVVEALEVTGHVPPEAVFSRDGRIKGVGVARLRAHLRNLTAEHQQGEVQITILDQQGVTVATATEPIAHNGDEAGDVSIDVEVPEPHGWFTWTLGRPYRYRCQLRVLDSAGAVSASTSAWFGFRRLELSLVGGRPVGWELNGQPLAPRGTRYTPSFWIDQVTDRMVQADVQLAARAGLDLLQVEGYLAPRAIVDAAEQHGLLLIQELPIAPGASRRTKIEHTRRFLRCGQHLLGSSPAFVAWGLSHSWEQVAPAVTNRRTSPTARPLLDLRPDALASFAVCPGVPSLPSAESSVWHQLGARWPAKPEDPYWAFHGYLPERWSTASLPPLEDSGSLAEAIAASQAAQTERATEEIGRARVRAFRGGCGFIWGTLVDAYPGIGSSIADFERRPKPVYWVVSDLLRGLMAIIDLAPDPDSEQSGVHTPGSRLRAQIFVVNEQPGVLGRASLSWRVRSASRGGWLNRSGLGRRVGFRLPRPFEGALLVETLDVALPEHWYGEHRLEVTVHQGFRRIIERSIAFQIGDGEPIGAPSWVPSWMLGQSYRSGSLQGSGDGFVFVLRTGRRSVQIDRILGLVVDAKPISLNRIQVVADGVVRPARSITEEQPLRLSSRMPLTVWVEGIRLAPDEHYLEWSFRTPRIRHAALRFRDYADPPPR